MANSIKVKLESKGAEDRLRALVAAGASKGAFETIGRVLVNRIRMCFKLGIDPWANRWQKIKWRAPRYRMQKVKDADGNVIDYKRKVGKDGNFLLTKAGKKQVEANRAGTPGSPLIATGRLRNSIVSRPDAQGVTLGTNLKYARVHQFGAEIKPKRAKMLVFPGPNGQMIFSKRVFIPARPYLPVRPNGAVALPPAWSVDVVRALRRYFIASANKGAANVR